MKIGKRTEKLVREAIVLGFAQGAWWGGYHKTPDRPYPKDSDVIHRVIHDARSNTSDLYPTLAKAQCDSFDEMERQCHEVSEGLIKYILGTQNEGHSQE